MLQTCLAPIHTVQKNVFNTKVSFIVFDTYIQSIPLKLYKSNGSGTMIPIDLTGNVLNTGPTLSTGEIDLNPGETLYLEVTDVPNKVEYLVNVIEKSNGQRLRDKIVTTLYTLEDLKRLAKAH